MLQTMGMQARRGPIMDMNKLTRVYHPARRSRVGADLSRPSPIYRPPEPGYFAKVHHRHPVRGTGNRHGAFSGLGFLGKGQVSL